MPTLENGPLENTGPLCPNCGLEYMEYMEEDMEGDPLHICHWCGYQEKAERI